MGVIEGVQWLVGGEATGVSNETAGEDAGGS